jgi:phage N-6-adenine-methyltransferase
MNEIQRIRPGGGLTQFDPAATRTTQAKLDALIAYAVKVKDWPLIEEAIDAKLGDQGDFVEWWGANLTPHHGGDRTKSAERGTWSVRDAEERTGISNQQVSRWRKALEKSEQYRDRQIDAARKKAGLEPADNHRAEGTGENEWYTPAKYIEAAREVMGGIDLDPASSALANETVQAERFFSLADDGLGRDWFGRVWLNPPYAQPAVGHFLAKLVSEAEAGHIAEAIALTHNYTDTAWFQNTARPANAICFTRGRIAFLNPDGDAAAPTQGQAFFYFGHAVSRFVEVFEPIGVVLRVAQGRAGHA